MNNLIAGLLIGCGIVGFIIMIFLWVMVSYGNKGTGKTLWEEYNG